MRHLRHRFTKSYPFPGTIDVDGLIGAKGRPPQASGSVMLPFTARIERERAKLEQRDADPLQEKVEATVRGMEAISTAALLSLIGLPATTGNGRRIAHSMRSLGFVPIKSRRFMPGGYRDTVTRGWARPVRESSVNQGDKVGILHPEADRTVQQKGTCRVQ